MDDNTAIISERARLAGTQQAAVSLTKVRYQNPYLKCIIGGTTSKLYTNNDSKE